MSNPQQITQAYQPGRPVVSLLWDMTVLKVWNTSTLAFESYNPSNATNYWTPLTDANNVGWYIAPLPTQLIGTTIQCVNYDTANLANPIGAAELAPPDTGSITTPPLAPQPITQAYQPGRTIVAFLWDMTMDNVWSWPTNSWVAFNPLLTINYSLTLADPNGIGWYSVPIPTALYGATFQTVIYDSANMSSPIAAGEMSPPDTAITPFNPTDPEVLAVINKALMFLGISPIASLTDDSEAAQRVAAIYNNVLLATLRSHYWKFATFVQIGQGLTYPAFDPTNDASGDPIPGWEYLYAYPAQCAMIRRIYDPSVCGLQAGVGFVSYTYYPDFLEYYDQYKDYLFRYKLVMTPSAPFVKAIAAHISPAYIEYTYVVTDASLWDSYFADAMSWNLAAQLARTLTGNTDLAVQAMQMFTNIVGEAKRLDSTEDRDNRKRMSSFQRARM